MSEINFAGRKRPDMAKKTRRAIANANRLEFKFKAAQERQEYCNSLSPMQRLSNLDRKLGKGVGAMKERARLQAKIDAEMAKKMANDPKIAELTPALTESIQAMVRDVTKATTEAVEAELRNSKKNKAKGRSKKN